MREYVRGAIRITASTVLDLPFLETGHKDATQLIDLTNHLFQYCADALISKVMDRGDAPDLVTFARPPYAGIEGTNSVLDRLPKSRQGAFLMEWRVKGRPIEYGRHELQYLGIREVGKVIHEPADLCLGIRKLNAMDKSV